ncbi:MAG: nucleotidyltransferase family protein [Chloroflexi bacterium]|nr:nucleotidyltransferase family protein [Chloroflexota bacterium]
MGTAAVILAAGASTRFGSPKQVARFGQGTMLDRVVAVASTSGLAPIVVVVPSWLEPPTSATAVVNDQPDEGLSRSVRLGIDAVPADVDAAVILLGDQPMVSPSWINRLRANASGDRPVVAMQAEGRIGPPVLLRRKAFHLATEMSGDAGLAPVLARHPELVAHIDVAAHAPDVDTPEDLDRLGEASGPQAGG